MSDYNPKNERIKRRYLTFIKEACGHSEATVNAVSMAINRFEKYTHCMDFGLFNHQQAVAFKYELIERRSLRTGKRPAAATAHNTLSNLKRFFRWLPSEPGYKSKVKAGDAEYFNLSDKDARIATAKREPKAPTVEQIMQVLDLAPITTDVERRDRALVAFAFLTGARDGAMASMKLKHVDLKKQAVYQDAREVKTKNSKTFTSYFFPVGDKVRQIVEDWIKYRYSVCLDGGDAPLFPADSKVTLDSNHNFCRTGLSELSWETSKPVRAAFVRTFKAARVPYFHPHSIRRTLGLLGQALSKGAEHLKAWSQNLGHESIYTTIFSYATLPANRQRELLLSSKSDVEEEDPEVKEVLDALKKVFAKKKAGIS